MGKPQGLALFTDIRLGVMNGLSFEEIEKEVIRPALVNEQLGSFSSSTIESAIKAIRQELSDQK